MPTVVVSSSNVANFPEGGGHFWVYMQYVHALRTLGCDVYWLERFRRGSDRRRDDAALSTFFERMYRYGLGGRTLLYVADEDRRGSDGAAPEYVGATPAAAEA